jgi:transcriptional regulator with XRE-family HTH domain
MTHREILQPIVVNRQQLNVVFSGGTITTMISNELLEFSKRMNLVADRLKIPPTGKNRQATLGKMFGVSQEAARKWLSGEGMPKLTKCIEIAVKAGVTTEWLVSGRGIDLYENTPEAKVVTSMQYMDEPTKYQVVKISDSLAEPEPKPNGHNPPKATGT